MIKKKDALYNLMGTRELILELHNFDLDSVLADEDLEDAKITATAVKWTKQ